MNMVAVVEEHLKGVPKLISLHDALQMHERRREVMESAAQCSEFEK